MSFLKVCMPSVDNRALFPQKILNCFPGSLRQLMFHLFLAEYHFIRIYKEIYNKRNCWDILWLENKENVPFFFFDQCFSNLNVHANLLGNLFKCRFWFSRSPLGPESTFPISFQDANITIYTMSITYDYKQIILILHGLLDGSSSVVFLIQALNLRTTFLIFKSSSLHFTSLHCQSHLFQVVFWSHSPCAKNLSVDLLPKTHLLGINLRRVLYYKPTISSEYKGEKKHNNFKIKKGNCLDKKWDQKVRKDLLLCLRFLNSLLCQISPTFGMYDSRVSGIQDLLF